MGRNLEVKGCKHLMTTNAENIELPTTKAENEYAIG